MWNPLSLKITNLFAYEEAEFSFANNQITTINGVNKTDSGVKSNGSGKSSILDCLAISCLGETLRNISKKEIVRNGQKSGEVVFVMENKEMDLVVRIETQVNVNKSNNALLYENDVLNTQLKDQNPSETYKRVLALIGISKDDLMNYFLLSKDSYQSFFLSGDTAKKEIVNRFSKADIIDKVDPLIKADIDVIEKKLQEFAQQVGSQNAVKEELTQQVEKELSNSTIEQVRQDTIKALEERRDAAKQLCDQLPESILAKEKEITDYNNNHIITTENAIKAVEVVIQNHRDKSFEIEKTMSLEDVSQDTIKAAFKPKIEAVQQSITEKELEIKQAQSDIRDCNQGIADIDKILAGEIDCPKCAHKFILGDKEYNIQEAQDRKVEFEEIRKVLEGEIQAHSTSIAEYNDAIIALKGDQALQLKDSETKIAEYRKLLNEEKGQINLKTTELRTLETTLNTNNRTLNGLKGELGLLDGKASYYIQQINDCNAAIVKEKEKIYPDPTIESKKKIVAIDEVIKKINEDIELWKTDLNALLEWQVRFKQFKSFLANTSISSIQDISNFFLEQMKTNLRVSIEGFRELSNGKLKEEISTLVMRDGLHGESFHKFSGGEKAKVDLACILAMQKVINLSTGNKGLNLLFIDEILESVDAIALGEIVKALGSLNQTIMLITHVEQNNFECKKIHVEKVNGISKVVSLS